MAKYRDVKASFRGHENWTIRFSKPNYPVSLDQASTSTTTSSSDNQSGTPWRQNLEVWNHRQQEHHPTSYFSIGPPMPGPWGLPPMMFPPCPSWVGWYSPRVPPPMHFHLGWSEPTKGFGHGATMQETAVTDTTTTSKTERPQVRKMDSLKFQTEPSGFPRSSCSSCSLAGVEGTK
jgi:hypothetical protein